MSDPIQIPRAAAVHMRDALRGFVDAADDDCGEEKCRDCAPVRVMRAALAALDAALAEPGPTGKDSLQVDAERYRWLRGELHGPRPPLARVVWKRHNIRESGDWTDLSDGQTLDEHIDAALAEPEHIHTCGPDCQRPICVNRLREIAAAVEAEREACAEYAAALAEAGWSAESIADALRVRGQK